jgi:hypothetical protein
MYSVVCYTRKRSLMVVSAIQHVIIEQKQQIRVNHTSITFDIHIIPFKFASMVSENCDACDAEFYEKDLGTGTQTEDV